MVTLAVHRDDLTPELNLSGYSRVWFILYNSVLSRLDLGQVSSTSSTQRYFLIEIGVDVHKTEWNTVVMCNK